MHRNSTQSCVSVCTYMLLCIWGWGGRSGPEPSSEPQRHPYSQRMHAIVVELLEKEVRFLLTLLGLFQNYGTGLPLEIASTAAVVQSIPWACPTFQELARSQGQGGGGVPKGLVDQPRACWQMEVASSGYRLHHHLWTEERAPPFLLYCK